MIGASFVGNILTSSVSLHLSTTIPLSSPLATVCNQEQTCLCRIVGTCVSALFTTYSSNLTATIYFVDT